MKNNITDDARRRILEGGQRGNETQKRRRLEKYLSSPNFCKECKKQLPYEKRNNNFCNRSCGAYFNNKIRRREERRCLNCGIVILGSGIKFCSTECSFDYKKKICYIKFDNGLICETSTKTLRKCIIKRDGYKCQICQNTIWNDKQIPLEIEHKDGNSENNKSENVMLVCPNCHAQTDTYKGKNKGNGRYSRKMRYREGKSY